MPESRSIVLSGPSGCGKSTIIKKLMNDYPEKFGFSVSRKNFCFPHLCVLAYRFDNMNSEALSTD